MRSLRQSAPKHWDENKGALQRVYSPNEGEQLGPGVSAEAARTLFRLADRVIVLNLLLEVHSQDSFVQTEPIKNASAEVQDSFDPGNSS